MTAHLPRRAGILAVLVPSQSLVLTRSLSRGAQKGFSAKAICPEPRFVPVAVALVSDYSLTIFVALSVAKAIAYSLNAWDALVRFFDDGRHRLPFTR